MVAALGAIPVSEGQTYTRVYGWGANSAGQMGHNSTNPVYLVPAVAELYGKTPVAIAVGPGHTLALDADGTIYAWGDNGAGQLGNNSTVSSSIPVVVNTTNGVSALYGKTVVAIAAGAGASYALTSEGKVYAWGYNDTFGQLGNNSTALSLVPIAVDTSGVLAGKTITKIAAGRSHVLVLASDGTVYSWGKNAHEGGSAAGQLGNNSSALYSRVPVAVVTSGALNGKVITDIAAGGIHSVACASDGTAYAWGLNSSNGQLGNGTKVDSKVPVAVTMSGALAGKSVVAVAAGYVHCMALTSDGKVYAWGADYGGRLGDGGNADQTTPVAVNTSGALLGKTVTAIAAGAYNSVCLTSDGAVYTWGTNAGPGVLGNNTTVDAGTPSAVDTTMGLSALAGATVTKIASGSIASSVVVIATSTHLGAPGAPIQVSATATQNQAEVSFVSPPDTGGATITGYTLTTYPGGATQSILSSPVTVTGLTNGVAYTFTVSATNSLGTSAASAASAPVTPPLPYVFTTMAGSSTSGALDATGAAATFNLPRGVAVKDGFIYVADSANHVIRKISSAGVVTTLAGSGNTGSTNGTGTGALFNTPAGVAVDSSDNVYVADSGNHLIRKITSGGVVTTLAGSGTPGSTDATGTLASFNTPLGVAVDASGNVYVADSQNNKIRKVTSTGDVTTYAGDGYPDWSDDWGDYAFFDNPSGIAVDGNGTVFVADSGNNAIRFISVNRDVYTLAGYPWATGSTDATGMSARFNNPTGVAIDDAGLVFVADRDNHLIRKITYAGVVTTLAGTGSSGWADGAGTSAVFDHPTGIAVDGSGVLYVADYNNHRIRSGALSTGPAFTGAATATGQLGSSFSYQIAFSDSPISYTASGLPAGLSVDTTTGVISGTPTTTGTSTVTLGATSGNGSASATLTLTINLGTQTITFGALANKTFGDASFAVSASATSGLTPTFSVFSGPATISGNTVTLTGAGTVVVRASQSGNSEYAAATPVDQSFEVAKANASVTLGSLSQTYDGSSRSATATTTPSGLAVSFTYDGSPTPPINAGSYPVVGTISDTNYTGTASGTLVVGKALAVVSLSNLSATYDGSAKSAGATTLPTGLTVTLTYNGNSTAPTSAGNYPVVGSIVDSNYFGGASGTLAIAKADQGLAFSSLANRNFGDAAFAVTATSNSGLPISYNVVSGPATVSGNTVTLTGAGSVTVRASNGGDTNYDAASVEGSFSVGKAVATVTLGGLSQSYDGSAKVAVATTQPSGLTVTLTYDGSATAPTATGSYAVAATIVDSNYSGAASGTMTIAEASQTLLFPGPAAHVTTDAPFTVNAIASSGLPVSFSVVSGPAQISGSTVTLAGIAGTVTIRASQSGGQGYAAVSMDRSFEVTVAPTETAAPTITSQPSSVTATAGSTATFSVVASGNPSPTYQWRRNGAALSGKTSATLSLLNVTSEDSAATFDVVVSNTVGSAVSQSATLTVTPASTTEQIFFGPIGADGRFALYVGSDRNAVLMGDLPAGRGSFMARFMLDENGAFRSTSLGSVQTSATGEKPMARITTFALMTKPTVSGSVVNGYFMGQVDGTGDIFNGDVLPAGPTSAYAGLYESTGVNGLVFAGDFIVGTNGEIMYATTLDESLGTGHGTISSQGQFTGTWFSATSLVGSIDLEKKIVASELENGRVTSVLAGAAITLPRTDRLVNISTRGMSGDDDKIIIGGFVIGGSQPRTVLVRAVGPGLAGLGVAGTMANPVLKLFKGAQEIASNDDWGSSSQGGKIALEAARLGAFNLTTDSKDAAILATLAPGAYTAQITRAAGSANGVALIEVYDASAAGDSADQQLLNISSRGEVGTEGNILISGFVITGNYPKKVLIRGVGPSLARQGVSGVLADPVLTVFQGSTVIAQVDNWVASGIAPVDTAAAMVGAFALDDSSKDAALVLTLAPGIYTAQVSGKNGSTGVAMVEVYVVPSAD